MPSFISGFFASVLTGEFKCQGVTHVIENGRLKITINTESFGSLRTYTDNKGITYLFFGCGNDAFWVSEKVSEHHYKVSDIIQHGADTQPGKYLTDKLIYDVFPDVTNCGTIDVYIV